MKITMKTLKGETFLLDVEPSQTILDLKNKIQQLKNFDTDSQKIVFKGKGTTNTDTLQQLGIKQNDFLVIMILTKKPQPKKAQKEPESAKKQQQKPSEKPAKPNAQTKQEKQQAKPQGDQEFNAKVQELTKMGFSKEQCEQALRAAFHNSQRAVEYLLTGIPPSPLEAQGANHQTNFLSGVVNNPNFSQVRQLIRTDPNALQGILQQLQQTSPELYNLISQHPEEFQRMILQGEGQGLEEQDEQNGILVTPEEQEAINRLIMLGFSKGDAAQAYFACDKSEQMAANLLFDRLAKGDLEESGGDMQGGQEEDDDNLFN